MQHLESPLTLQLCLCRVAEQKHERMQHKQGMSKHDWLQALCLQTALMH